MQTERPVEMLAGRYALEAELGRGGTGMVWRARDTVLERTVAVKLLRPTLAEDPVFVARLADGSGAVARVSAPGLVRLLDSGADRGVSFLVREHVEGESLRERLEREGPLGTEEAMRIVLEILEALGTAHAAGLLHLDVKPENVLLAPDGRVALADLGVGAAVRAARPDDAAELLGLATEVPELADPAAVPDERADVFLAGVLLDESLTGGPTPGHDVPRPVGAVLRRALSADPADRYGSASAFADALREMQAESAPPPAREVLGGLRAWVLVPALVILVALGAIALGVWLGRLELGGPLGVRAAEDPEPSQPPIETPTTAVLPVAGVATFDPYGDGSENDAGAPAAIDGNLATAWRSENYFDGELNKPGVGLVLDLGGPRTVTGFRLWAPHPGWTFGVAVGEDPQALAASVEAAYTAGSSMRVRLEPATGRYVLLWIVSVVDAGDGDRAEVAEIEVVGPDA